MSQLIRGWWSSCFSDRPEKHKLGRWCWNLASCQVSLNSVRRLQSSPKCLGQLEVRAAILFFRSARKTQRTLRSCFLLNVEFCSVVSEEKSKMSANQMPENHKFGRWCWNLASCQVSLNSVHRFQRRSRKCLSQLEVRAAILGFFCRSARKTQTWQRTFWSCFLSSFVEFRSEISEKLKMWKVNDGQTDGRRNSTKLDRKQDFNVLYQVYVFRPIGKNMMATPASDWLRHFRLLLWKRSTEFNDTWR